MFIQTKSKLSCLVAAVAVVTLHLSPFTLSRLWAGAPTFIAKQGQIRVGGQPVTGAHKMHFRMYTSPSAPISGTAWEQVIDNPPGVYFINGMFNYPLTNGIDGLDFSANTYYMSMAIDNGNEMLPREPLAALPYAFAASTATCLRGNGHIKITGAGDHYIQNGNVGIGVTNPASGLEVKKDISGVVNYVTINNQDSANGTGQGIAFNGASEWDASIYNKLTTGWGSDLYINSRLNTYFQSNGATFLTLSSAGNTLLTISTGTASTTTLFQVGNATMTVLKNGNVGIGKTNPSVELEVNGRVKDKTGYMVPVGTVQMYAGTTAPTGWLLCNGGSYSTSGTYADLFAIVGYTFGGSGENFNVPNFQNLFPRGANTSTRAITGVTYPASSLGNVRNDQMQGHRHRLGYGSTAAYNQGSWSNEAGSGTTEFASYLTLQPITDGSNGEPRTGNTTEPQSLGINFIIKY